MHYTLEFLFIIPLYPRELSISNFTMCKIRDGHPIQTFLPYLFYDEASICSVPYNTLKAQISLNTLAAPLSKLLVVAPVTNSLYESTQTSKISVEFEDSYKMTEADSLYTSVPQQSTVEKRVDDRLGNYML